MKHVASISSLLFLLFISQVLVAQMALTPDSRVNTDGFSSGVAVVVTDMNGDGVDDIARLRNGRALELAIQGDPNTKFFESLPLMANNQSQWTLMAGDVNNDGRMDMVSGGNNDGIKLLIGEQFEIDQYAFQILSVPSFFAQSSNFTDVNNDGFLDAFVCNDDGLSRLFINDGTGNLLPSMMIDFSTTPASDNSGNYGSLWTDIDSDGDIDLYVAKCRQGVNNPEDPRRINQLFLNDGNGAYKEMADSFNLAIGAQSWTADFGDFDNDGDFDCFITNHDLPSQLLENIDNAYFEDITESTGIVVDGAAIQGVFRDMNNDGLLDIVVAGTESYIFENNGDKTFTTYQNPLNNIPFHSGAIGDLNDDGFLDIYGIYQVLFNGPNSSRRDLLWVNEPNENNYLKVFLRGVESNLNGVGARIEVFGPWGVQTREVHAGESYGITNSLIMHFGLGESEKIDSLRVKWPSGQVDVYEDSPVNTTVIANEGGCLSASVPSGYDAPVALCTEDPVVLNAPDVAGAVTYLWSNGSTEDKVEVATPGVYHLSITDENGCLFVTKPIQVIDNPDNELVKINLVGDSLNCDGSAVTLSAPEADSYQWNNGETTQTIEVTETGVYSLTVPGFCMPRNSENVSVTFIVPDAPMDLENDTIEEIGIATLSATGEDLYWYDEEFGGELLGDGPTFVTEEIDTTTTYYVENHMTTEGPGVATGMPDHPGGTQYNGDQFNGMLLFDVFTETTLESVTVITEFEGMRTLVLLDADDQVLLSKSFEIDSGKTVLPLEWPLSPGEDYKLGTDTQVNLDVFGSNSPKLFRSEEDVVFPYVVEDIISINESNFGIDFYYYFFDWQLKLPDLVCVSPRVPVTAVVLKESAVYDEVIGQSVSLVPNPSFGTLQLRADEDVFKNLKKMQVLSTLGQLVFEQKVTANGESYNLASLPAGAYIVRLWTENGFADFKWIRQN